MIPQICVIIWLIIVLFINIHHHGKTFTCDARGTLANVIVWLIILGFGGFFNNIF